MKHLHFVQSTEPLEGGGLGRAAWELSDAIRFSEESSVLVTTGKESAQGGGSKIFARKGPTPLFYAPLLWQAAAELVHESDVIHGHGFYVGTNWALGRAARQLGKPLVYHVHGIFEPWILARSRWKKRLVHWLFEDANMRHAALWRALTNKEADQIRQQGMNAPIIVCPNGINLDTFDKVPALRSNLAGRKQKRSLLFLARLHPKKGLGLLLPAWAAVPKELRKDWQLMIAGPDELNHRTEMEALASQLDISGELQFIGPVSGEPKLQALAEADAFVLPSHSEGFSVAILEAMACQLPVLATHACNFPDLAKIGGGWCVDVSSEAIRQGLLAIFKASEIELKERGATARKLVEQSFTWPKIAKHITDACKRI